MEYRLLYITAPTPDEARRIARELVERRLVACANIVPSIESIYWWDGEVQSGAEALLLAKTKAELVPHVIDAVRELHSYACPCIVSLPIEQGFAPFLQWIGDETLPADRQEEDDLK